MTTSPTFVYGVLDVRDRLRDAALGERCRELTFAWSRWSYAGPMIEHSDPDQVLALAAERGVRYCLVQACGHLVIETLRPKGAAAPELVELLIAALGDDAWLVGRKVSAHAIHDACWLVDLQRWQARGRPHLQRDAQQPWLSLATGESNSDGITDSPPQALLRGRDLEPQREAHAQALSQSPAQVDTTQLQPPLGEFVASLARTLDQCQRGVFIWNLEPYDDVHVEDTHVKQAQPLRSLYCVAAGFKPNAILRSHGYTADTDVVFFDYSGEALAFRQLLIEHWDGYDLPSFLLPRLNPAETHYWLRSTARGQMPQREELEQLWTRELQDWGGADAFAGHWNATRRLRHRFVQVDLLQAPETALGMPPDGPSLVWWSNAFSSVHALWHLRHAERLHAFSRWIDVIAERCPQAWLLGADANNCPVGGIQAAAYASLLSAWQGGMHEPLPGSATATIRF